MRPQYQAVSVFVSICPSLIQLQKVIRDTTNSTIFVKLSMSNMPGATTQGWNFFICDDNL
jgi:hypothetical protein